MATLSGEAVFTPPVYKFSTTARLPLATSPAAVPKSAFALPALLPIETEFSVKAWLPIPTTTAFFALPLPVVLLPQITELVAVSK